MAGWAGLYYKLEKNKTKQNMQASISHPEAPWEMEITILTHNFSLP